MPRSAPTQPPIPTEGGTYEVGKDGALICVQQTVDPTADAAVISPDPVIEDTQDDAAPHA